MTDQLRDSRVRLGAMRSSLQKHVDGFHQAFLNTLSPEEREAREGEGAEGEGGGKAGADVEGRGEEGEEGEVEEGEGEEGGMGERKGKGWVGGSWHSGFDLEGVPPVPLADILSAQVGGRGFCISV